MYRPTSAITTTTPARPLTPEIVRLWGWDRTWDGARSAVQCTLFGEMVKRAIPVVREYHSDLFHDAQWVRDNVTGPMSFLFMVRYHGTHVGDSAEIAEQQASTEPRTLYRVTVSVDGAGQWSATFAPLVIVPLVEITEPAGPAEDAEVAE